ncbi:hypothetical protein [Microbacterium sp. lyk4-40-TSB-66]|uniref:hypothetical protein n=1 Tax=Microbacterium sp. lyk4-40-TSB-66 TaxID=3040294 RepID=UPI00254E2B01|nr:hypothetical protein [Microbacterium sp. lyk4-40-TSB-66]
MGFDIAPESFPGVRIVDTGLPGFDPWKLAGASPLVIKDSIDHHNALMSDDEHTNGDVLRFVKKFLKRERREADTRGPGIDSRARTWRMWDE